MPKYNATSEFTSFVTAGREVVSCRSGTIQLETGGAPATDDGTMLAFPDGAIVIEGGITVNVKRAPNSVKATYNRTQVG